MVDLVLTNKEKLVGNHRIVRGGKDLKIESQNHRLVRVGKDLQII